ncbi:alpha-1 2-mannosidase [Paraglaciecola chathamensis]|uniref:Alpha-1 2-mannosidase n=2 Tax=Paraglaciecola chathamensis TaxID=368405 RepID=A0A8H9IDL8_9ALTE|nr:GH92 family glycosyl hydrolase [Paraglaciecola oceanifecundans]GGZ71835.1 alpha-1 2-mannosidase [Paraglaciecola oceanifecundans]
MMKKLILSATVLALCACTEQAPTTIQNNAAVNPLDYVDPFIGTDGKGKTYPGATVPYGMVQLSPDNGRTGWDWISGYFYPDNIIAGFSHTHLSGTGAGDLYDISFMPLTRPFHREKTEGGPEDGTIVSRFSHQNEQASPGYYQVFLDDYGVNVELTAGLRTGFQKYQFADDALEGVVRVDLGYSRNWDKTLDTHIQVIGPKTIAGYRKSTGWASDQRVYFYSQFSQPIDRYTLNTNGVTSQEQSASGENIAAEFDFDFTGSNSKKLVTVRTAISSVSIENAKQNLLAEGVDSSFSQVKDLAQQAWREQLSRVEITADKDDMTQFYTAMYHTALAPRVFSDSNGEYKGPDGNIHKSEQYPRYEFFSLWDTFRALHPWKTIVEPARTRELMASIMAHYDVAGRLPVWNFQGNETDMMMGYHSVPVLIDAYFKGLLDASGEEVLAAAMQSATQNEFGLKSYQALGYVPFEERSWNVSLTLEYAFDDWAIAQLASSLGQNEVYQTYQSRGQNYRNLFDPQSEFMRAKSVNGEFRRDFDPNAYHPEDYCEANAWQYSFFVPQDVTGLIDIMGGAAPFEAQLDAMFEAEQTVGEFPEWISGYIGQYVHGNEPSHHVPYLYQYVGKGYKTQKYVRQVMDELYHTAPDGLSGNEDAGQMSAWYLFSALGFYPVNPVSGEYVLGSPEVSSAKIHLENGNTFSVQVLNQSKENVYVQSVSLNGQPLQQFFIQHSDILAGGSIVFEMGAEPK